MEGSKVLVRVLAAVAGSRGGNAMGVVSRREEAAVNKASLTESERPRPRDSAKIENDKKKGMRWDGRGVAPFQKLIAVVFRDLLLFLKPAMKNGSRT